MHFPKGGMCATCLHANRDCSSLDFESMKVIERYCDHKIVKCSEYEKKEHDKCKHS